MPSPASHSSLDAARAHDALVEGQLQLAFGRMEVPRGALHDRFEHRLQDRSRDRLLDPAAHAAIADDLQVRLGALDRARRPMGSEAPLPAAVPVSIVCSQLSPSDRSRKEMPSARRR